MEASGFHSMVEVDDYQLKEPVILFLLKSSKAVKNGLLAYTYNQLQLLKTSHWSTSTHPNPQLVRALVVATLLNVF